MNSKVEEKVTLNISGIRHETTSSVLKKLPATRLSKLTQNLTNYDPALKEYCFERHPGVFAEVLNYYRTGKLHYPTNVCGPLFEEELEFWGLDPNCVEPCCWMTYTTFRTTEGVLTVLDQVDSEKQVSAQATAAQFGWEDDFRRGSLSKWQNFKPTAWGWFDNPKASRIGNVLSNWSSVCTILCTVLLIARTIPSIRQAEETVAIFYYIELGCNLWFIVECVSEWAFCPKKLAHVKNPNTIIAHLSSLAFFVDFFFFIFNYNLSLLAKNYVEMTALFRIFRLMRLTAYSNSFKFIILTLKASADSLVQLFVFVPLFAVVFAASAYVVEKSLHNPTNHFNSIPDGIWWGLITICTTGYGDMSPQTLTGKILGGVCGIAGVLTVALPVPIIVENFVLYNTHRRARAKLPRERRIILQTADILQQAKAQAKLRQNLLEKQVKEHEQRQQQRPGSAIGRKISSALGHLRKSSAGKKDERTKKEDKNILFTVQEESASVTETEHHV